MVVIKISRLERLGYIGISSQRKSLYVIFLTVFGGKKNNRNMIGLDVLF